VNGGHAPLYGGEPRFLPGENPLTCLQQNKMTGKKMRRRLDASILWSGTLIACTVDGGWLPSGCTGIPLTASGTAAG
jgi:hypothetical protein